MGLTEAVRASFIQAVLESRSESPAQRLVLIALASRLGDDVGLGWDVAAVPRVELARMAGVSVSSVQRVIGELVSLGVLEVVRESRQHVPRAVRIHVDHLKIPKG